MYDDPRPEPQSPLPRGPTSQPYRGPVRIRRSDGRREVWREGTGYVPEGSLEALPPRDQEDMQIARRAVQTSGRNVQMAEQFLDANRTPRPVNFQSGFGFLDAGGETGGLASLPVPNWGNLQNETRQRMEGLTNQMVRENIQPGQAGTMNSIIEQMLARQQYPTTDTLGKVNGDRVLAMLIDNDEITALADEAEQWTREHGSLTGFAVDWQRNRSRQVRADSEDRHRRRLRLRPIIPATSRPEAMQQSSSENSDIAARRAALLAERARLAGGQ